MKKLFPIWLVLLISFALTASAQVNSDDALFGFLKDSYNKHDKKLRNFLILELDGYIRQFPESGHLAEATYYLAKVHVERGKEIQGFAMLLKMLNLYPNSPMHSKVVEEAHVLVADEKKLRKRQDWLAPIINGIFLEDERANRHYRYLEFLYELNQSSLYDYMLAEYYDFLANYKDDDRTERINRWIAEIYGFKKKYKAAEAGYAKYERLFPASPQLPDVQTKRADLLYRKLKEYDRALMILSEIIDNNVKTDYAAAALFLRAEIKSDKKKDYNGAVSDYRQLITDQPNYIKAVDALFEMADLQSGKLKASLTAIEVYNEIVDSYPDSKRGVEALKLSAKIYLKVKDASSAAEQYSKVAEKYSNHKEAPEMLLKAAGLCEGKLKNYERAIGYYQDIVDNYPEAKQAVKARKKILKLEEKLGD